MMLAQKYMPKEVTGFLSDSVMRYPIGCSLTERVLLSKVGVDAAVKPYQKDMGLEDHLI